MSSYLLTDVEISTILNHSTFIEVTERNKASLKLRVTKQTRENPSESHLNKRNKDGI